MRRRSAPVFAASLILGAASAGAETFDFKLYRYCKPGTFCGHVSDAAARQYICQAVQEMNLVWEPTGISFRPVILPIDSTSPLVTTGLPAGKNKYHQNPGCKDDDSFKALREHWRDNVARADTTALSMMVTGPQERCCSGIPRTFKNLDKAHGIYCDSNPGRTFREQGGLWAHEMGHHWSLAHTHGGYADTADGQNPAHDADAPVAKGCTDWDANGDAAGCNDDQDCIDLDLGTCSESDALPVVADTPADRGPFEKCKLKCQNDPDKASCTTNADCDSGEGPCACPGADEDKDGDIIEDHTWLASTSSEREIVAISTNISQGSPHGTWCNVEIKDFTGGMTVGSDSVPTVERTVRNVMSYHPDVCSGPYIRSGVRREAFTADQLDRVAECRQSIEPRDAAHLPDVCANQGGDLDHDGICGQDDNCPLDRNTCQTDTDLDGDGDECDLCPNDPAPTGDIDHDGIGDACDPDKDGDGCLNGKDDHPEQGELPGIHTTFVGCSIDKKTDYVSDAADTDGDGVPNCEDPDDDGDLLCDAPGEGCESVGDPCPEIPGVLCTQIQAGEPCPPIWFLCGLQCVEFFVKIAAVINPDPTRDLVFDRITMVNGGIYAAPLAGKTPSESVVSIAELAGLGAGEPASPGAAVTTAAGRVRVELWERPRAGGERLAMVIGEYDAAQLELGELEKGGLLRLVPCLDEFGGPLFEAETTHEDGFPARAARDRDADGIADLVDNCVLAANATQADADGDDFGNACDADFDGDGRVGQGDVARVEACAGVDVQVAAPILEPAVFDGEPLGEVSPDPDKLLVSRAALCAGADLDGNGRVDAVDARLADGLRGQAPGPSAIARDLPAAAPQVGPVCADPGPIQNAAIELSGLRLPTGRQRLSLKGTLVGPFPADAPPNPVADGALLSLHDGVGRELLHVRIPAGAFDPATGTGWIERPRQRRARYVNRGPGIGEVVLRWPAAGQVEVEVSGDELAIPESHPALPLLWQFNLDPRPAATDRCGETDFLAAPDTPLCTVNRRGASITCR